MVFRVRAIMRRNTIILLMTFVLAACAPEEVRVVSPDAKAQAYVAFLQNGKTHKEEVLSRFGMPSGSFEDGRILTYRMGLHSNKGLIPYRLLKYEDFTGDVDDKSNLSPPSMDGLYQVIVVFDDKDVLVKNRFLKQGFNDKVGYFP